MLGQTFAHYWVTAKLGSGGMGEVYRATDSKLARDVALKVLPEAFAGDPQRMARFSREAQVLAALNHPNIAAIYGLEESEGTRALVMELVQGPTLADRIAAGPIPLEEALQVGKQIADALEYAHERGIIHRDLKPANIKVTPSGAVKVLDFGLAKAIEDTPAAEDISQSPTLSAVATKAGIILGTAAYMSPEQAKGKPVDRRADIWALGVVLFEMLSGKQLYTGETASETLAHVITQEPNWSALPSSTPQRIRELLRRCLTKEPKQRLQAIGDARIALEEVLANPAADAAATGTLVVVQPAWRRALPWSVGGLLGLALLLSLWRLWPRPASPTQPMRLSAEIGADAAMNPQAGTAGSAAVLSPDGSRLAVVASEPNQPPRIYVRSLEQLRASVLPGTEGARNQFFSPDGQWIAFFADGKLKKIAVQGGAALVLCDAYEDRGGVWSEDGTIVFTPTDRTGLFRVSSAGGKPEQITTPDKSKSQTTDRWPQALPGGKAILFTSGITGGNYETAHIVVQSLVSGQRKTLLEGGFYARYVPTGHLVYMHEGTLFGVPFNLARLELTGVPTPVLEGVASSNIYAGAQFSFSSTGTLVYLPGKSGGGMVSIYWLTADGKLKPLRETVGNYFWPRFSPDGKRLALSVGSTYAGDVWAYDWERDIMNRLTFSAGAAGVWTPDGRRIAYSSGKDQAIPNIYWKRADGSGDEQRLTQSKNAQFPMSWTPDGKYLAFAEQSLDTGWDIWILPVEGNEQLGWKPGAPRPFLNTPFGERAPAFSPDGRWLAYSSNESGSYEVYVRPFPGPGGKWQISTAGGLWPEWSRDGRELFYRTPDQKIMVANYRVVGESFQAEKPRLWGDQQFTDRGITSNFDLHPDGKRFAVLKSSESPQEVKQNHVTFIFHFFDELRRAAPRHEK